MKDLVWQMYRQLATKGCRAFLFTTFLASTSLPAATYSSGGINLAIPDPGTINIPIVVTDTGLVSDVNLRLRLSHTFDSDLVISLIGPDNTTVILANRRGNGGHDFGAGNPDCSGTLTVFDDSASFKISLASPPFAGTYLPDQALTNFNGKAVNGTWKLRVQDIATGDQGTIHCIQLEITKSGSPPSVLTLLPANLTATRADFQASVNPGTAATSASQSSRSSGSSTYCSPPRRARQRKWRRPSPSGRARRASRSWRCAT